MLSCDTQTPSIRRAAVGRALRAVTHPAVLAAIVLLLINDHWLRWTYPSWWTGKIGDAAWLFFMPFIIAPVFAWLLPSNLARRDTWVCALSCLAVGGVFAAVKTLPAAHAAFRAIFAAIFGWESILLRDPTDLLTLPALGLTWWLWHTETRHNVTVAQCAGRRARAASIIALAALATIANSGPIDPGITCLHAEGDRVYAVADWSGMTRSVYRSDDGGLTWEQLMSEYDQEPPDEELPDFACHSAGRDAWLVAGAAPSEFYRITPGRYIERSTDEGRTWDVELHVSRRHVSAANEHYSGYGGPPQGPKAALLHPESGNLIVAMEWKGVVVRRPDGEWHWVTVGSYAAELLQ